MNTWVKKYIWLKSKILNKNIFKFTYTGGDDIDSDYAASRILLKPIKAYNMKTQEYEMINRYTCIEIKTYHKDTRLGKVYKRNDCKHDYLCTLEEIKKYTILREIYNLEFELSMNGQSIKMNIVELLKTWDNVNKARILFAQIIDLFTNFDEELIQAFGAGIFDSINDIVELNNNKQNTHINSEVYNEFANFISNIYTTVLEFGEPRINTLDIEDCINHINYREKQLQDTLILEQKEFDDRQKKILETLRIRQELLKNFNNPIITK